MLPPKAAELSLPPVVASSSSGGVIVVLPENVEHGTHVTTTLPLLVSESRVFDYEFSGMESGKRDHDSVGTHSRRVTLWWVRGCRWARDRRWGRDCRWSRGCRQLREAGLVQCGRHQERFCTHQGLASPRAYRLEGLV